jgi:G:T-mismatch repair DNA endonuclease (very short patch repair protein)
LAPAHLPQGTLDPATRAEFWREKFAATVERDRRHRAALGDLGWRVFTVWECETTPGRVDACISRLADELPADGAGTANGAEPRR